MQSDEGEELPFEHGKWRHIKEQIFDQDKMPLCMSLNI